MPELMPVVLRGGVTGRPLLPANRERGSCCTIGNFDGVHLGHQYLLSAVRLASNRLDLPNRIVITFHPHPLMVLGRLNNVRMLTTFRQRCALFATSGITAVRQVRFSRGVAILSAEEFFRAVIIEELACRHLVLGPDTALGRGREGTLDKLQEIAGRYGCTTEVISCIEAPAGSHREGKVSSRRIREEIAEGQVADAAVLLGRPFSVQGRVMHGDKRGRLIGFPTINISLAGRVIPRLGVYACLVAVNESVYSAAANVGVRPTFGGNAPILEAHLLGVEGIDFYGKRAELYFLERVRDEKTFSGVDALKEQIKQDCHVAGEVCRVALANTDVMLRVHTDKSC
jgi:riboflavin kinase/FMN adenylyltransferase